MMVTFVSQCEKKALIETRRILDNFADRIGGRTWQTVITKDGLAAVRKLLKKTASKNTAVACHWAKGRNGNELAWIVGNRQCFNSQGIVPVHRTKNPNLKPDKESDWHYLPLIQCLTALAALFHDWGKASACFQAKLDPKNPKKVISDPLRHEWVSVLFLSAFIVEGEDDASWLARLGEGQFDEAQLKEAVLQNIKSPLSNLPPAASLIAWLVVSHHKLPQLESEIKKGRDRERVQQFYENWLDVPAETLPKMLKRIGQAWGYENRRDEDDYQARVEQCLSFPKGLPSQSMPWLRQIKKWANKMLLRLPELSKVEQNGGWRVVLHHARLSLMLADHYYSSQDADPMWKEDIGLIANTRRSTDRELDGTPKQKLDEHLAGVAKHALQIVHWLPTIEQRQELNDDLRAFDIHALKKKSTGPFIWQEKAVEAIKRWRQASPSTENEFKVGFFAVNMASTGTGKTICNAKVMRALSLDKKSLRYVLALGLRTLTLQTGDEYRGRVGLRDDELAVLIGSKAVQDLHNQKDQEGSDSASEAEKFGSESEEALLDDTLDYEGPLPEVGFTTVLTDERSRKFLYAPVLVCTIDHLMAATETKRGGRYILPCLRLLSSDLVIDEVDDFNGADLIAIGRLIHLAGMLGRKVMISSATIPPDLAEGYFRIYQEGWMLYSQTRGCSASVGCAWIDEFKTEVETVKATNPKQIRENYAGHHQEFVEARVKNLGKQSVKRKGGIIRCDDLTLENRAPSSDLEVGYFSKIQKAIVDLHQQNHEIDPNTQKNVSFGVVRVANIPPCIGLSHYLMECEWPKSVDVKVMAYHSQQVLLLRSKQEKHLDAVLKRKQKKGEPSPALENPIIREHLDQSEADHVIFIVVATPVEEVGRDHDFDWAVVEPSSYRSIVQLAGRVLRHRDIVPKKENMALLQYNLKALKTGLKRAAYCRPGYEEDRGSDQSLRLGTHNLKDLLEWKVIEKKIDAVPRIKKNDPLRVKDRLADLEHAAIAQWINSPEQVGPESMEGWLTQNWWLTALPQLFNPFRKSAPTLKLYSAWNERDEKLVFQEKDERGYFTSVEGKYRITRQLEDETNPKRLWLKRDYELLLNQTAEYFNIPKRLASLKYGEISLSLYQDLEDLRFCYSDQLGLRKKE